jgi:hypothetical protein
LNTRIEWGDVGRMLLDGFPMLDLQTNLPNHLRDCATAKQALLQLARLLMRPVACNYYNQANISTFFERSTQQLPLPHPEPQLGCAAAPKRSLEQLTP